MHRLLLVCAAALLAGCAATPSQYGSYATVDSSITTLLAADATAQLVALFPPAQNSLIRLKLPATDAFGQILVAGLRAKGYSVATSIPTETGNSADASTPGLSLGYIFNRFNEGFIISTSDTTYSLTLFIGSQVLARNYGISDDTIHPESSWVRRK